MLEGVPAQHVTYRKDPGVQDLCGLGDPVDDHDRNEIAAVGIASREEPQHGEDEHGRSELHEGVRPQVARAVTMAARKAMKPIVMGSRSQTSRALSGAQ